MELCTPEQLARGVDSCECPPGYHDAMKKTLAYQAEVLRLALRDLGHALLRPLGIRL